MKFDLEKAINQWLKTFRKHKAFDDGSVREMEVHLRDHIDDLLAEGYSEQEAFNFAVDEFGEIEGVADQEFMHVKRRTSFAGIHIYRNYLKIALRGFTRQPFFTFLNIFGLAIGMAGSLLIALYIHDELSFDKMFADADRIYRVNIDNQTSGEYKEYASAPGPMGGVLIQDCPQVEQVTRFREVRSILLKRPEATLNIKEKYVTAVDSTFFEMFGIDLLEGDSKTALKEPNTLVLTKSAARNLFGNESALDQELLMNNDKLYKITGIIDNLPANSFLRSYSVFISMESFEDAKTTAWNTWYFPTFVKLHKDAKADDLQRFLSTVKENYLIPWAMTFVPGLTIEKARADEEQTGNFMRFNATALPDIRLYTSNREGDFNQNSDIKNVYILGCIGVFLMFMASVNFMNLSTAHSLKRAKEVGVRKVLGSGRLSLVRQFLTESVLISCFALVLALVIVAGVLPLFNTLAAKSIIIPLTSPLFWAMVISGVLILGLLSGSYPAFFLSGFAPARVLKGGYNKVSGGRIRNGLVVVQFTISVFLIIGSIVVFQQVKFIQNKDLGFQKDQILVLDDVSAAGKQLEPFREEIKRISQVKQVSLSSYLPTPSRRSGTTFFTEGSFVDGVLNSEKGLIIGKWGIDYDYAPILGLEIIAGRNFSEAHVTDSSAIILNETAVAMLDVSPEEAIGMRLTEDFHRQDKENMEYLTIVGVVKDFHFESLKNNIGALSMTLGGNPEKMIVKLSSGNFTDAISQIEEVWRSLVQGQPFSYYFMDESFNETYKAELRLGNIFLTFTVLSILIACLGLFGLASFNAEKRSKEIGIRKVLGASVRQVTYQLTGDFLKLVAVAIALAMPLGWFIMVKWLEEFTYRVEVTWWMLAVAGLVAVSISIITVSYQSIKAAMMNPVKGLRSE
ncbi:ABC transporter permease [Fulvivirga ulvae]|uniref:ABC transporter permease n=1 Tax=Fulvivirga ulvae TaxID=2904245 RepID=UPI001F27044E|nr:ABC transporter permease [Fulvivirga ulvae]UII31060.1 ABC transporter permease [Fulvivirga ulvae]